MKNFLRILASFLLVFDEMGVVDLMSQCFSLFELLVRITELLAILKIGTSAHDRDPVYEPWSRSAVHPQSPPELLTCELIRVGRKLSSFARLALPLILRVPGV